MPDTGTWTDLLLDVICNLVDLGLHIQSQATCSARCLKRRCNTHIHGEPKLMSQYYVKADD